MFYNRTPNYLSDLIPNESSTTTYETRSTNILQVPLCRTQTYRKSFLPSSVREWNMSVDEVRNIESSALFKKHFHRNDLCYVHHILAVVS